jgi:NAD(P)-dependent dehydrogenase (short-subunit alcohol dehydrogenase family)
MPMLRRRHWQRCSVTTIKRRHFLGAAGATVLAPQLASCARYDKRPAAGVPVSRFNQDSTAEEVTEGLDLEGKLAVVTGCTAGIGFETMRVLAKRGAYVVGTSRSLKRAEDACRKVVGTTTPVALDLGDFDSVAKCADDIRTLRSPIDMLICNAGYRGGGNERQLINGVEKHFVINHLGHFILINRLMERLYLSSQGRIVIVSSRTAYRDAPDKGILFDDLAMVDGYSDSLAYGHSKLANALCSLQMAELLRGTRITSNALHPGVINTEIDRNLNAVSQFAWGLYSGIAGKTVEQGAATSCYVATSEQLGNISGRFFEDCNAVTIDGSGHIHDKIMAGKLLQKSIDLTADWLIEFKEPRKEDFDLSNRTRKTE